LLIVTDVGLAKMPPQLFELPPLTVAPLIAADEVVLKLKTRLALLAEIVSKFAPGPLIVNAPLFVTANSVPPSVIVCAEPKTVESKLIVSSPVETFIRLIAPSRLQSFAAAVQAESAALAVVLSTVRVSGASIRRIESICQFIPALTPPLSQPAIQRKQTVCPLNDAGRFKTEVV